MEVAIIGLIGTLLGGIIVGVANSFNNREQFARETNRQNRQLTRQKLEELCQLIDELKILYGTVFFYTINYVTTGNIFKPERSSIASLTRLRMLVQIYAPSLLDYCALLHDVDIIFNEALFQTIKYNRGDPRQTHGLGILHRAKKQIEYILADMMSVSANLAREYF